MNKAANLISAGDQIRFNGKTATVLQVAKTQSNAGAYVDLHFEYVSGGKDQVSLLATNSVRMA